MKQHRKNPETALTRSINELLQWRFKNDLVAVHPPSEGKRDPRYGRNLKRMGWVAGIPDFLLCLRGGFYAALEVKTEAGRLSPAQKEMAERIQRAGGKFAVVRSVQEAESVIASWLQPRTRIAAVPLEPQPISWPG